MNRQVIPFACQDDVLFGSLDLGQASGSTGLLMVSGGGEVRAGAWGGQARLAARLAGEGVPVFRFDRRGVGDSCGQDPGFLGSAPDLAAALDAFRAAAPHVKKMVAFGNCDAASALMLHAVPLGGIDALVLANPWTLDPQPGQQTPGQQAPGDQAQIHSGAALRRYYLRRLADPRQVWRLLSGQVNPLRLLGSLRKAAQPTRATLLSQALVAGLEAFAGDVQILLASGDRTAQLFESHWPAGDTRICAHASASHSFSEESAREWLFARLLEACR